MQIKFADDTTLDCIQVNGKTQYYQGATRDTLAVSYTHLLSKRRTALFIKGGLWAGSFRCRLTILKHSFARKSRKRTKKSFRIPKKS